MKVPSLARAAADYAARGWLIFPLRPHTKLPLTPNGFKAATSDPQVVRDWWARSPNANIGLVPAPSGLLVFDVDGPEADALAGSLGLCAEPTLTALTGRRFLPVSDPKHYDQARHLYFSTQGLDIGLIARLGNPTLGGVLEVKAAAGYVVVPPSVHPESGACYQWEGVEEAVLRVPPGAVAALAGISAKVERGMRASGPILPGARRPTLFKYAGALRRVGCSEAGIVAALRTENASRCQPPLEDAVVVGLASDIRRYQPGESASGALPPLCRVPVDAAGDPHLTPDTFKVLVEMGRHADRDTHVAWPSASTLAQRCSISLRTAQRALQALERRMYLTRAAISRGRSTTFRVMSEPTLRNLQRVPEAMVARLGRLGLIRLALYPRSIDWGLRVDFLRGVTYDRALSQVQPPLPSSLEAAALPPCDNPRPNLRHPSVVLTGEQGWGESGSTRGAREKQGGMGSPWTSRRPSGAAKDGRHEF